MIAFALIALMVVRSLVPVVGVLWLGWSPDRVLLLFYADTILSIGALVTAMIFSQPRRGTKGRAASQLLRGFGSAVLMTGVLAVFLGLPLFFMLGDTKYFLWWTVTDPAFRLPLLLQAIAACWWGAVILRQLRTQAPEVAAIPSRFALTFLRWIVLIGVAFTGIPMMLGRGGPYLLVVVYSAAMIASELNPRWFLRSLPSRGR